MSASQHGASAKAIFYAFAANLGIAIAKSWAAWFTMSGSMLAEAIHSFADCGNQALLWVGLRQSQRPPDAEHPLGYGKVSFFWSFVVALMLFSVGGLFSIYEGWHKLYTPEPLNQVWVALVVLGISIVLEAGSTAGCLREIRKLRGDRGLLEWLRHTRNAELVVVLGEDTAALLGLALAFVFLSLAALTGSSAFDALGSICIGLVLIVVSLFIATRMKSLIVGRSADPELAATIDEAIAGNPEIVEVLNVITLQFGPDVMLAAKVRMREGLDIGQAVGRINRLEASIRSRFPEIRWCFVEPDVTD